MDSDRAFYSALHLSRRRLVLTVANVSNTGWRNGEELVQLYVRLQSTSTAQPMRALKEFQRIALAPEETKKVTFHLASGEFAIWNHRNQFVVEPAKISVWISPDSATVRRPSLRLCRRIPIASASDSGENMRRRGPAVPGG